ncbi:hypothetical protein AN639_07900 [Candidatus Epulonipiscium fishelsonii]|uniref:Uncharacterized protein n=1 Tax=Candidatus Epulonipiscium fishelsonii TaxID=77094 RepID=A0ACC8X8B4_9FIRM|nr:hypothetical protein AN396_11090 [Epulopiscium sp. SCG-B11WGA-EpuloA1]ONI38418.1 hypothetical protein AN639_07900 [Epulopiscium sp. SCG-B05WGA-EpuloA1]ONI47922.1 hypothetical protein AN644_03415 [Epulopiscium sp. SCG-C06WGA-EpuloA1]
MMLELAGMTFTLLTSLLFSSAIIGLVNNFYIETETSSVNNKDLLEDETNHIKEVKHTLSELTQQDNSLSPMKTVHNDNLVGELLYSKKHSFKQQSYTSNNVSLKNKEMLACEDNHIKIRGPSNWTAEKISA